MSGGKCHKSLGFFKWETLITREFHKAASRESRPIGPLLDQPTSRAFSIEAQWIVTFHKLGFFRSCFGKGHRRLSCFLGFEVGSPYHMNEVQAAEYTGNSAAVLMGLWSAISFRLLKGWFPRKGYIQLTSFIMGISINISWVIVYQWISWEFQELTKAYLIWGQVCFTKKKNAGLPDSWRCLKSRLLPPPFLLHHCKSSATRIWLLLEASS